MRTKAMSTRCEMLVLAPKQELDKNFNPWKPSTPNCFRTTTDTYFNDWLEEYIVEGIDLPFDENHRLPSELPESLEGIKCIVIDQERSDEFAGGAKAEKLRVFRSQGGYLFHPCKKADPQAFRNHLHRTIATANLKQHNFALHSRLHAIDEGRLFDWLIKNAIDEYNLYTHDNAGWAWCDPSAYHQLWPLWEATEYCEDPSIWAPMWEHLKRGLDRNLWKGGIPCGGRFALRYYEKTGEACGSGADACGMRPENTFI